MEKGQGITWDELADIYDKHHSGRKARTLPMDTVLDWALARKDLFYVGEDDSICKKIGKKQKSRIWYEEKEAANDR